MLVLDILEKLQDGLNKKYSANWKGIRTPTEFQTECILETAELIECIRIKWWKHNPPNWEKAKLELVDILHFALSGAMLTKGIQSVEMPQGVDVESLKILFKLAMDNKFVDIIHVLIHFANLLDFDIISYYVAKFTLNKIRLLLGYRDGTYQKVIEGVEDNDLVLRCILPSATRIRLDEECDISKYEQVAKNVYDMYGIPTDQRFTLQSYI